MCAKLFLEGSSSARPNLNYLDIAYCGWGGLKDDFIGIALGLEKTESDVVSFLENDNLELTQRDLMVISAFSTQRYTLKCFIKSHSFNRARHEKLLINLFRFSAKVACLYKPDDPKVEEYRKIVFQNYRVDKIISETERLYQSVGDAIRGQINWSD